MIDSYGRVIDYIRISLTDRCNLRCIYCMPEEGVEAFPHSRILTYEEIERIVRILGEMGIRKVKLTGGEPLVRRGCAGLVARLKALPGIETVTLTTNGVLLADQMKLLADAGLDAINISIDSLDPEGFRAVTRKGEISQVLAGLEAALAYPGINLKVNCVPLWQTDRELLSLALLARDKRIHVRFIEMMPIGLGKDFPYRTERDLVRLFEENFGPMLPIEERLGNGPGHYYAAEGFCGRIGFISAISHKFCDSCNRIRLTSTGVLKPCLQYEGGTELRPLLEDGADDRELARYLERAIAAKPAAHHFYDRSGSEREAADERRVMAQIGG